MIVFIHGVDGSHHNFKFLQKHFLGSVSFDLPGFGKAEKEAGPFDIDLYLNFLISKIKEKSILVGHSWGAILAKEFALRNPELVEKLILISYPLQSTSQEMRHILEENFFTKIFLRNSFFGAFMCKTKIIWKYFILPFAYIFRHKYFDSVQAFFHHNYDAEIKVLKLIINDTFHALQKLSMPYLIIAGEKDRFINQHIAGTLPSVTVKNMGHSFWGYESEIATIISDSQVYGLGKIPPTTE